MKKEILSFTNLLNAPRIFRKTGQNESHFFSVTTNFSLLHAKLYIIQRLLYAIFIVLRLCVSKTTIDLTQERDDCSDTL